MAKKRSFGVDIGTRNIKIVQMTGAGNSYLIEKALLAEIDPHKDQNEKIENIANALRNLILNEKLEMHNVVFGLTGPSANLRFFTMPFMTEEELKESMQWEAKKHLPFDLSEVQIDAHVIHEFEEQAKPEEEKPEVGKPEEGAPPDENKSADEPTLEPTPPAPDPNLPVSLEMDAAKKINCLLVAAKKEIVTYWLEIFDNLNITPSAIDVGACALVNLFDFATKSEFDTAGCVALIDAGYETTIINILKDGNLVFNRVVMSGAKEVITHMARAKNTDLGEAERVLAGQMDNTAMTAFQQATSNLLQEIQRSLLYAKNAVHIEEVQAVTLYGGFANIEAFSKALGTTLNLNVKRGDAFAGFQLDKKINVALKNNSSVFAVATGLAYRGLN